MEFMMVYWHWLVFGMVLMLLEIFLSSFTVLWFGLGAVLVAVILFFVPQLAFPWQLFIWVIASSAFALLWFKYLKPMMIDRTKAGISREAVLGEAGQVIRTPAEHVRGMVRFSTPLMGADEWPFICHETVALGDRVFVKDISGNTLIVSKQH
jgi:membrane protein implicated in regulation of membrane protease activity